MTNGAERSDRDLAHRARWIRVLTFGVLILSVPLFAGLGLLGRQTLVRSGVEVVPWAQASPLFIMFALFHMVPVLLYTSLIRRACLQAFRDELTPLSAYLLRQVDPTIDPREAGQFRRLLFAVTGSCLCLLLVVSMSLFGGVVAIGPGGFAELVFMTLLMFPLTLGYLFLLSLVAAGFGGLVGSWIYRLGQRGRA